MLAADWRDAIGHIGAAVLAAVEALHGELTPAQGERLLRLVNLIDETSSSKAYDEEERNWALFLEHLPGLAPALELVRNHCCGFGQTCCHDPGGSHQRMKRRGEEAEE